VSNRTFNQLVAEAQADVDAGRPPDYSKLFADAVADLDSKHPCNLTQDCQEARGCPRCISGAIKGDLGILSVDVFESGTIRITTTGHDGERCTVAFRGVPVTVHQDRRKRMTTSKTA
jgi:hypothetical protein